MPPETKSTELKDLLTPKELDVTRLVAEGHSNASIAVELGCRPGTIATHMTKIFIRSGCRNRTQLAAKYLLECGADV